MERPQVCCLVLASSSFPGGGTEFSYLRQLYDIKTWGLCSSKYFMMFPPVLKRNPSAWLLKQNLCKYVILGKWFLINNQRKGKYLYYQASIGSASSSAAWPRISGWACLASDTKSGWGRYFLSPLAQRASGPKHSQIWIEKTWLRSHEIESIIISVTIISPNSRFSPFTDTSLILACRESHRSVSSCSLGQSWWGMDWIPSHPSQSSHRNPSLTWK